MLARIEEDMVRDAAVIIPLWPSAPVFRKNVKTNKIKTNPSTHQHENKTIHTLGQVAKVYDKGSEISFDTFIRHVFKHKNMPKKVAEFITSKAWKKSTASRLTTATRRWVNFCKKYKKPVVNFTGTQCLECLQFCFEQLKLSYYAIRQMKEFVFCMSKLLNNSLSTSDRECIVRFVKGVFNERPPIKFSKTAPISWNVDTVLKYFKNHKGNHDMGLNELGGKAALLVLLSTMCRIGDVSQMNINRMKHNGDYIEFELSTPTKTFTDNSSYGGSKWLQVLTVESFGIKIFAQFQPLKTTLVDQKGSAGPLRACSL